MKNLFMLSIIALLLTSCGSAYKYGAGEENVQKSNLTVGVVKSKIKKGVTSQDEILKIFGSPNMVTKNKDDHEVWSYNRQSTVDKGGSTDYAFGQRGSASRSNQSFDLIITFDSNDVVYDYSVVSTAY